MSTGSMSLRLLGGVVVSALAAGSAVAGPAAKKAGLHIPRGQTVSFTTYLRDGGGRRWDIQSGLNIGRGTNNVYSGAMYCQVQGSNMHSQGHGWKSAAGDEIEIGPWSRGSVEVYRRVKVYKDRPLARWLDIFVNSTGSDQVVPVRIYSCYNYTITQVATTSGGGAFGGEDWGFVTAQGPGRPALMHVVCGPRSKLRPSIRTSGNTLYVNYSVVVPAGQAAVLCYFEGQGDNFAALGERMKKLRPARLLRDLPAAVRKLIVNFRCGGALEQIDLDRGGAADTVLLANGDAIRGRITNDEFLLHSLHGELKLPAGKVLGFVSVAGGGDQVRAVLLNGQVITGTLPQGALRLVLATGGELKIPYGRIKQCAYRVTKDKPEESPFADPLILLRNGDRLAFDADELRCSLHTRHGPVALSGKDLVEVRLTHDANGVHRATFLNGSSLAGLLTPEKIVLPIKLGRKLDIPRDMVLALRFADDAAPDDDLTRIALTNGDELAGKLLDESYALATDFGSVPVKPANVLSMAFNPLDPGVVAVTMWDGKTTLRGRLQQDTLRFAIDPGPELKVHIGQIVALSCSSPLPPDKVVADVKRQVARLSSSSYKDREEAQDALIRMGRSIAPLLKKYTQDSDPEVRQRVRVILDRLGPAAASGAHPPNLPNVAFPMAQRMIWR